MPPFCLAFAATSSNQYGCGSRLRRSGILTRNQGLKENVKYAGASLLTMFPSVSTDMQARANSVRGTDTPPLHFIYHVPKCAGRTIDQHLASALPAPAYHRLRKRRGLGRFVTRYDSSRARDAAGDTCRLRRTFGYGTGRLVPLI